MKCLQDINHYDRGENYKFYIKFPATPLRANELTHCGLVMPYGDMELGQHWLR